AIAAVLRNTIREGVGEHDAGREISVTLRSFRRRHLLRPASRKTARAGGSLRTVAAELIEPDIEVDIVAAEAALRQDGGDFGGLFAGSEAMRIHNHARPPRPRRWSTAAREARTVSSRVSAISGS